MSEIKKIFYSMGEVSEMLDVNPSLLRFWEKKFDILRPNKNKKGNRMFTPEDIRNLKIIYHLVKENGMTLAGAQKRLKQNRADIEREMELSERLHAIKAILLEVKQRIDDETDDASQIIIRQETPESSSVGTEQEPEIAEQAEDSAPDNFSEEDLEMEVEMAFASEIDEEDNIWDAEPEDAYEENPAEYFEEEYDDALPADDTSESAHVEISDHETDSGLPTETHDDEPETEIIMEEGMLFAVEAIKPRAAVEQPEAEPEPPVHDNQESPKIIEQTLF